MRTTLNLADEALLVTKQVAARSRLSLAVSRSRRAAPALQFALTARRVVPAAWEQA